MTGKLIIQKLFCWGCFALCLALWPATVGAADRPENIRTELMQLQVILQKQEQLILAQQQELSGLKNYVSALELSLAQAEQSLSAAEGISQVSQQELAALKTDLEKSSALIEQANKELAQLSKAMESKLSKLRKQKTLAWTLAAGCLMVAASR